MGEYISSLIRILSFTSVEFGWSAPLIGSYGGIYASGLCLFTIVFYLAITSLVKKVRVAWILVISRTLDTCLFLLLQFSVF